MQITKPARRVRCAEYTLEFDWRGRPGSGFVFPCDPDGNVLVSELAPEARANLSDCLLGRIDVVPLGVQVARWSYREPAEGRCVGCGRLVVLADAMTNSCDCGYEYNGGGQLLAPRSQWNDDPWDEDGGLAWGDTRGMFL